MNLRKKHSASSKAQIAMTAIKERKTIAEIASESSVHPTQVAKWKKELLDRAYEIFEDKRKHTKDSPTIEELYEQIGRLNIELEWLKKKSERIRC